jgi:methylphosphotriester-DNA--protein-cysteine methyltransferase
MIFNCSREQCRVSAYRFGTWNAQRPFYGSAAAAQEAGFRPCLRCRPEIASELNAWRGTSNTVSRALALIAEGALDGHDNRVEKLATRLGVGERHLRRPFVHHFPRRREQLCGRTRRSKNAANERRSIDGRS